MLCAKNTKWISYDQIVKGDRMTPDISLTNGSLSLCEVSRVIVICSMIGH